MEQMRVHFPKGKEKLKAQFQKACAKMKSKDAVPGRSANGVLIEYMEKVVASMVTRKATKGGKA